MSLGSVNTIKKKDLKLKCTKKTKAQSLTDANELARFNCCHQLPRCYPTSIVNLFTDEKLFTVETKRNTQNDHTYARVGTHKKTLSHLASVGVSALERTAIHFILPGVKVNGHYYREVLLERNLLPDIKEFLELHISTGQCDCSLSPRDNCTAGS